MNTRDWPIRSKLTALVVVPVTALLALWIFATSLAFGPALDLLSARTLLYDLGRPGETVVAELQRERRLTAVQLAGEQRLPVLAEQRARTDRAVAELRRRMAGDRLRDAADDLLDARLDTLAAALDGLPAGRRAVDRRAIDRTGAASLYSGMVSAAFEAFAGMASLPDNDLNRQALAVTALGRSRELLGQVDTLLAGAVTAGRFAEGEHEQLVLAVGSQRFLVLDALVDLPAGDRTAYQRVAGQPAFVRLRAMQDALLRARPDARPPVDVRVWQADYDTVQQRLREYELAEADELADRSVPVAVGILTRLAVAGLLGLAAVVVSVLVALRVGRSLVTRLSGVRTAALDMAEHRLPDVVARLRRGEEVDVDREAPPLDHGGDEIGQVGRAFNEVRRTAVRAAVDEVTLRRGLNEVFLNIARRSQGLVHRQLALLDRMERHTEDPDELAGLFQVDHLSTRLRRHAEDLVILAGAAPGRGWREPVAMVDVIRGAISEVESYDRVDITTVQPAGVVGRAVGDVIHLLAELIENGTVFSAPETRVEVTGRDGPDGYTVEITDHGLGMAPRAVEDANRRLARPPEFDPTDSARLGLFVVARLAARHGVRVRLRSAGPGGGVTAVAVLPVDLVTDEPPPPTGPPRSTPAPGRTTVPRPRATRPSPTRPPTTGTSSVAPPDDADGLPRRVRRRGPVAPVRPVAEAAGRTPEEARRAMAALQAGTARGRRDSARLPAPAGYADPGAPPTTPDGYSGPGAPPVTAAPEPAVPAPDPSVPVTTAPDPARPPVPAPDPAAPASHRPRAGTPAPEALPPVPAASAETPPATERDIRR